MDYQNLQQNLLYLAQSASLSVLNYHLATAKHMFGLPTLDPESLGKISERIQRFLPIAHMSQNKNAAYLEVVCDAALTVADKYDINKRWFYTAVQGMASMAIVPSMYENAGDPVPLSNYHLLLYEGSDAEDGSEDDTEGDAHKKAEKNAEDDAEDDNEDGREARRTQLPGSAMQHVAAQKNNRFQSWTDAETREFVDRKLAGESFQAIGARLGRTVPSISGKWCHMSRTDPWKDYIAQKRGEASGALSAQVEQPEGDEGGGSQGIDDSDKMDVDEQAIEEVQPDASAVNTVAVTNPGWTDAEIRELISHKINGLRDNDIVHLMRRNHGSIRCQWVNLSTKINGRWFGYIHDQYRAKEEREKQEKAAQVATGVDAGDISGTTEGVTGQFYSGQNWLLGSDSAPPAPSPTVPPMPTIQMPSPIKPLEANQGVDGDNSAESPEDEIL